MQQQSMASGPLKSVSTRLKYTVSIGYEDLETTTFEYVLLDIYEKEQVHRLGHAVWASTVLPFGKS